MGQFAPPKNPRRFQFYRWNPEDGSDGGKTPGVESYFADSGSFGALASVAPAKARSY